MHPVSSPASPIVGVILAGGQSRRMGGGDKGLLPLGARPVVAHVIERLRPQVDDLILNANGDPSRFAALGLTVVPDAIQRGSGPLAGILAGLSWTRTHRPQARGIVTAACDTPFFPADLVARLTAASDDGTRCAVSWSGGRMHPVFAFVPLSLMDAVATFLAEARSLKASAWMERNHAATVDFALAAGGLDPFFNLNAPSDFVAAEAAYAAPPLRPTEK
jgi:molybdenum cofactor guanylyltransferase